ncbi:MAG: DUF86 domain-containing protein [Peptococcaceae bacterium]|nr:DUF86 domain-containing protein [Peptococcaceae bacterium]
MTGNRKIVQILERMIKYCDDIDILTKRFGKTYDSYSGDFAYRYACSMCILQVGELASKLDEDFRDKYDLIPWRKIRGMRNIVAHDYDSINDEETWATIESKIPELKAYCELILREIVSDENNSRVK